MGLGELSIYSAVVIRRVTHHRWALGLAFLLLLMLGIACSTEDSGNRETLTVFAASSLIEAFGELAQAFEVQRGEVSVELNYSGSQRLRVQLEHGAKGDLFASADKSQMDLAVESGLISGQPVTFATNTMVGIASLHASPGIQNLAQLGDGGVTLVLAQPEVPAGAYARRVLANLAQEPGFGLSYPDRVIDNVVSNEPNVRSVLQKVASGEAAGGIVYLSDIYRAGNRTDLKVLALPIPPQANVSAAYPMAVLREGNNALARAFLRFVMSRQGQEILRRHGFGPASSEPRSGLTEDTGLFTESKDLAQNRAAQVKTQVGAG